MPTTTSSLRPINVENTAPAKFHQLVSRRFPPSHQQAFQLNNIFIFPSLYLILLGAVIVVLWVMSVQFLLNLGFLLVFLLWACSSCR
jgi:hypothetical protein